MADRLLDATGFVTQSRRVSDVSRAVEEIAAIHAHLAAREIYRGWRSVPVALSGLVGIGAAVVLTARQAEIDAWTFLRAWFAVGFCAMVAGCAEIAWHYTRHATALERRRTRVVMGQIFPALMAGIVVPLALVRLNPAFVVAAPGLWALCFGLAIVSARACLPPASVWAAAYYLTAGVVLLILAGQGVPAAWTVGATFGVGQGLVAMLLHATLERGPSPREDAHVG
jgi:hypothetical protein